MEETPLHRFVRLRERVVAEPEAPTAAPIAVDAVLARLDAILQAVQITARTPHPVAG